MSPGSRACCGARGCYKARHLRAMQHASQADLRRLVAELGACEDGLNREQLARAGMRLAARGATVLSWQCVNEMARLGMRPSISLNNALMDAYGRNGRWDQAMSLLLRMQQAGLQPSEQTFIGAIRAGSQVPGGAQFAEVLRPQLEAAARREAAAIGVKGAGAPAALSPRSVSALVSAEHFDAEAAAASGGDGLRTLRRQLAEGTRPDARMYRVALAGCAKAPDRWQEALQITSMMELWVREERTPRQRSAIKYVEFPRAQLPEIGEAYAAAVAACDEGRQKAAAFELLPRMHALGVPPRVEVYNAAISACRHGGDLASAEQLLVRARSDRVGPDTTSFNSLLSVLRTIGGMGEDAFKVLERMQRAGLRPDEITYLELIAACRPTPEQARVLKAAAHKQRLASRARPMSAPALALPSARAPAAPAGGMGIGSARAADGAALVIGAVGAGDAGGAAGMGAPVSVEGQWADSVYVRHRALELLNEMQLRGLQRDERHFGAAIELCQRHGDLEEALRLLLSMPGLGLRPDSFCLVPAVQAAANAGEHRIALRILNETEAALAKEAARVDGHDMLSPSSARGGGHSLGLFAAGGPGSGAGAGFTPRGRLFMHDTALMACGTGHAPLATTMALLPLMRARGVEPAAFSYDSALHACRRKGGWLQAFGVLHAARAAGVQPTAGNVSFILSLVREVGERSGIGPPWSMTVGLLDEAVELGLTLPAEARVHVLAAGRVAGVGWDAVRQTERLEFEAPPTASTSAGGVGASNRQAESQPNASKKAATPRRQARQPLEVQLQGELFCLAAQDGTERTRLAMLLSQLKRAGSAPTPLLIERALHACVTAREGRAGWQHVATLLDLAAREQLQLTELAVQHVLHSYPPLLAGSRPLDDRQQRVDGAMLNELAHVIRAEPLRDKTLMRLMRLCKRVPAAADHARQLLAQRRRSPRPHATPREKHAHERLRPPRHTDRTAVAAASRTELALSPPPPPMDVEHDADPFHVNRGGGERSRQPRMSIDSDSRHHVNGHNGVDGTVSGSSCAPPPARDGTDEPGTPAHAEQPMTTSQGAQLSQLIGRVAAHESLAATAEAVRTGRRR